MNWSKHSWHVGCYTNESNNNTHRSLLKDRQIWKYRIIWWGVESLCCLFTVIFRVYTYALDFWNSEADLKFLRFNNCTYMVLKIIKFLKLPVYAISYNLFVFETAGKVLFATIDIVVYVLYCYLSHYWVQIFLTLQNAWKICRQLSY